MKPVRDPLYRAWVRSLGCCVCGRAFGVEAAHTSGGKGMGQKTSDLTCIPLCELHHRSGALSYHVLGERIFEMRHRVDVRELRARFSEKPALWIEGGWFVSNVEGQRVQFHVELGPQYAFEQVKALKTEMFRMEFRERRRAA